MSDTTTPVVIYSTPTCAFCKTEKQWLDSLGVNYVTRDIEVDEGAKDELLAKLDGEFRGVPTTIIGDEVIVGFNVPALQGVLRNAGLIKS